MTTAADKLRADILAEVEHCKADLAETECALRVAEAMLRAHDAAVAAMRKKEAAPAAPRVTEKRRNIKAEVYKRLTGEPQTVDALVAAIGRTRNAAVEEALDWHAGKGAVLRWDGGWVRADLLPALSAAAE